jgi:hypothetical protein
MKSLTWLLLISVSSFFNSHAQPPLQIIQADTLQYYVQALSHDSTLGRFASGVGAGKAAKWISEQFAQIGLEPISGNDGFYHVFQHPFRDVQFMGLNVMGAIYGNGKSDKVFIISSHYDHVGTHRENANLYPYLIRSDFPSPKVDSIYNGANDDASGVAAMIMLAKYFMQLPPPDYNLFFIAFTGEELGFLGSSAFLQAINAQKIQQVINLEMLGRPRGKKPDQRLPFVTFGKQDEWVIDSLNKHLRLLSGTKNRTDFFLYDEFQKQKLYSRSDNYTFAKLNIATNSIMLSNGNDKYYHHPDDEWDTIDYPLMENIVRSIALAITPFVYTPPAGR